MALGMINPLLKRRSGVVSAMTGMRPAFSAPPPALPENYGFNDLAEYEEVRRRALGGQAEQTILDRRKQVESQLAKSGQERFSMQNPAILEDLNRRGLFTSPTAVNSAQAEALKGIELENQDRLLNFDETALAAKLQGEQDALDAALDLRRGDLEQRFGEAAANREEGLARDLARQSRRQGVTQSLIGAGGSILGAGLGQGGFLSGLFGRGGGSSGTVGSGGTAGAGEGGVAGGAPGAAGGFASALPLGLLAAGGIAGYQSLSDKGKSIVAPLVNPIKTVSTVGKAVSKISKKFCFDGMTPITMADGSVKPICELDLDDETSGGGIVESVRISKTDNGTVYDYKGEIVTGSHAVKENGVWIRVEDSENAVPRPGESVVYSVTTRGHRLFVNGIEFADDMETDDHENLTIDESLSELNRLEGLEVSVNGN